jgi:hypothetical protein
MTECGYPELPPPDQGPIVEGPCERAVAESQDLIVDNLPAKLDALYEQIVDPTTGAPSATVVVVGYPEVFSGDGDDCSDWSYSYGSWFSADEQSTSSRACGRTTPTRTGRHTTRPVRATSHTPT